MSVCVCGHMRKRAYARGAAAADAPAAADLTTEDGTEALLASTPWTAIASSREEAM